MAHFVETAKGGFQQMTNLTVAIGLTIPAGATSVIIQCEGQNVRWRADGTDPTAAVGEIMRTTDKPRPFTEGLSRIKFIEVTPSAKLNVQFCY